MKKRLFALCLALAALLSVPTAAGAMSGELIMVCRLWGTSFNSLGDALTLYEEGDVIELLVEIHKSCQLGSNDGEVRVRGVDGVQVPDDLFYVIRHEALEHRTEGDVHIFKCVQLERDPELPEYTIETAVTAFGNVSNVNTDYWPGETAYLEVEPNDGCEVVSVTVLDSQNNEIPTRLDYYTYYWNHPVYSFTVPSENLPLTAYATVKPVGETDEDCPSLPFTDVDAGAWYHMAVDGLVERGAVSGKDAQHFTPYEKLTRAEAVTILYRLAGSPAVEYSPVYADVPEGRWFTDPILWATGQGIVGGVGDGLFAPDELLNREQLWVMLLRLSGDRVLEPNAWILDTAAGDISEFAVQALSWAYTMRIRGGIPVGARTAPTRAETAVTVYLYLLNREKIASDPELRYEGIELNR